MNFSCIKSILQKFIIFLFFLTSTSSIASLDYLSCPGVADYQALVDLYNATDGPNWTNQTGWADGAAGTDCDICNWHGVTCDDNDRVKGISLYSNNLTGTLPTQINGLELLETLGLGNNPITGTIPDAFGNFSALKSLAVYNTDLIGSIPDALSNLANLETLYLFRNDLTGQIPSSLGNLSALKLLVINSNDLTGDIPAALGNLSALERLDVNGNDLTGELPTNLFNLSNLTILNLASNDLSGQIPSSIGNLTQIEEIRFQSNNFSGEIPSELGNLTTITRLYLYQNDLEGCIPPTFQNLCSTDVRLFGNPCLSQYGNMTTFCAGESCESQYRAALMALYNSTGGDNWTNNTGWGDQSCSICGWHGVNCDSDGILTSVVLSNNNLIGTLPVEIGDLTTVTRLIISSSDITGPIPSSIGNLSSIEELSLSSNELTGPIPAELYNLTTLTDLSLGWNELDGQIDPAIGNLSLLEDLRLESNNLTGEIPSEIGNLGALAKVFLFQNELQGCIPSSFQNLCTADVRLYNNTCLKPNKGDFDSFCAGDPCENANKDDLMALYNATGGANWTNNTNWGDGSCGVCNWHGVICDGDGNLTSLNLSNNNLIGSLPVEIGNITSLESLRLNDNQLSGVIPPELYNLVNLTNLYLNKNQLTGDISTSIANLSAIEYLYLHTNSLTGEIPSQIGNLSTLQRLYLNTNDLEGCIPASLQNFCSIQVSVSNNLCLSHNAGNFNSFCAGDACEGSNTYFCPTCSDEILNGTETDIDCGGICEPCGTCTDGIQNGTETDIDCGGSTCDACVSCTDGIQNGAETGIDCGGSCPSSCPSCTDGIQNGTETGIDCGGNCTPCGSCTDGIQNGTETGIDCGGPTCGACDDCPQVNNYDDLMALYNSTNGDNWINNSGWGQDCGICNWHGITCDNAGNVVDITMFNNNVTGPLPPEIGNITSLETLVLSGNNVSSLPSSIGNLVNMNLFQIGENQLSGPLPVEVGNMTNLTLLLLQNNQLTGPIPSSIGNLTNLINLSLFNNQIDGPIPSELGNIPSLLFFRLDNNQLTGPIPSELSQLTNLINGKLSQNQLTGCIPSEFSVFCSGNNLILDQNPCLSHNGGDFSSFCAGDPCEGSSPNCNSCSDGVLNGNETEIDCGGICPCLVDCSASADFEALIALYNSTNGANWNNNTGWTQGAASTDCDYCNWSGITCDVNNRVTEIYLYQNNLVGPLPTELGQLTELQKINISESALSGPIPSELGNLTQLSEIVFFGNQLTGSIPSSFSALTNLESLGLGANQLSGEIPSFIGTYTGLTFLGLNDNNFEGAIPKSLGNLSNLQYLWLSQNNLSGCIPGSLHVFCGPGLSIHLESNPCLSNADNFFSFCAGAECVFPADPACDFSSCSNGIQDGQEEGIDCCGLCPPCQVDCSNHPDFNALMAFYTATNGSVWGTFGWAAGAAGTDCDVCSWQGVTCNANGRVTELYFKAQNLSGQLPSELDQLTELISLKLEYNLLTGPIPASLGNLQNLQSLYLNGNSLVGEIPFNLSNLNQLQYLNLSNNQLSGCYDIGLQSLCSQLDPSSSTNASISNGNMFDAPWEQFCNDGIVVCDCPSSFFSDGQLPANHNLISLSSNDCPTLGTVHINSAPNDPCAGGGLFWMLSLTESPPVDINDDRIQPTTQDFMYMEAGTYFFYLIQRPLMTSTDIIYLPPTTFVIDEVECFPCIDDVVIDQQADNNLDGETIRSADYIEVSDIDINQDLDTWAVDYFEITGPFEVEPDVTFSITIEDECECTVGSPCDDEDPCTVNDTFDDDCACIGEMDPACVPDCTDGTDHGDPCNDGDACTDNDVIDTNCNCVGTTIPNCTTDCTDGKNFGDPCDDGDACTENDEIDTNCNCIGVAIPNCTVCPSGEVVGTACDDLDDCTENDGLDANCDCIGIAIPNCTSCPSGEVVGTACDDLDDCTENDELDANCDCIGVAIPNCTSCPSGEAVGTACDDLDECTENDLWQSDAVGDCACVGVLIDENNNGECDFLEPCDEGGFLAKTLKSNECHASQFLNVVVSEFSNGERGVDEYIELYVKGKGSFDLRGLIVDDKEGIYKSGNGFSAGRIRFANHPNWAKVQGGSIILIYNEKHRNKNIGNEDPTDKDSDNIFITALSQPYFYGEELNAESKYIPIPPAWDLIWLYDKNDEINIRTCDEQLLQRISYGYEETKKPTFGDVIHLNKSVRKGLIFKDMMDTHVLDKTKPSPGEYNNRKHKNLY